MVLYRENAPVDRRVDALNQNIHKKWAYPLDSSVSRGAKDTFMHIQIYLDVHAYYMFIRLTIKGLTNETT